MNPITNQAKCLRCGRLAKGTCRICKQGLCELECHWLQHQKIGTKEFCRPVQFKITALVPRSVNIVNTEQYELMHLTARCIKCGGRALVKCSDCGEPYCGLNCQEADWNEHQKVCKPAPSNVSSNLRSQSTEEPQYINPGTNQYTADLLTNKCIKCGSPATNQCEVCEEGYCSLNCQAADREKHQNICKPKKIDFDINNAPNDKVQRAMSLDALCGKCERTATVMCIRCEQYYCSKECQVSDWEDHKKVCRSKFKHLGRWNNTYGQVINSVIPQSKRKLPNGIHFNAWKRDFLLPRNEFFDVIVQHIEKSECAPIAWVIDAKVSFKLVELGVAKEDILMMRRISAPHVGDLVAAPLNGLYNRARVVEIDDPLGYAVVRFIDYGKKLSIYMRELFEPVPMMKKSCAYAFRVHFGKEVSGSLAINTVISIRLMGRKTAGGYYQVDFKPKK